ncbi:transient receptor potential cation channel subfamily M member 2-like [Mytilus edulis]|uniref:transient receptor potential cation channel subfamily M member 2-like n=1 Tax=Mytilus edulis TaxID=6550 RepID=UPI0039EF00F4
MAEDKRPPSLYLIFDHEEDTDDGKMKFMYEIMEFANKSKLPCHIVGQTVLFESDSTKKSYIHAKTERKMVEKLKEKGFTIPRNRNTDDDIGMINYFKQTQKRDVLPILISFENGKMTSDGLTLFAKSTIFQMPHICFKKSTDDILWSREKNDKRSNIEYKRDNKKSMQIKKSSSELGPMLHNIQYTSKFRSDYDHIMHICTLMITVCLKEVSSTEGQYVAYYTAVSTYLLEKGKWTIYKQLMKTFFKERYLEFMNKERFASNSEFFNRELESNGLLFFALIANSCSDEALQLLEKGDVGIHHILIGCVLLDDDINSWKTPIVVKEKLQRYKSAFTERAIAIISIIYGQYTQNEEDEQRKEDTRKDEQIDDNTLHLTPICKEEEEHTSEDNRLCNNINHAERLLLNHGYLRDAITTENNLFLKNETVKTILNRKWYGTAKINLLTMLVVIVLAVVHPFVLPFLMINLERRPLQWLYKMYQLPFLKVVIQMLGFLVVIVAYAYMLLFDYNDDGITSTDWFIIVWMVSFLVDEIKQIVVALMRKQKKNYASDWWNILDWLFIVGYTSGMLVRAGTESGFKNASKCLLLLTFMLLCIRVLNLCCMTEFLGPKLVIIRKMIKQTVSFMTIMTVIMVWYSVSLYALLYPNSEISWTEIENIMSNGYWVLFGELNLDAETLTEPDCTFNRTMYESGILQRCPTTLGVHLTPYLKALYGLIAVILLMNLLIALYSDAYNLVQQESEAYWRKIQLNFLEKFCIKTPFPTHMQILALPGTILSILWLWCVCMFSKCGRKPDDPYKTPDLNSQSMIVRAFLYEANYDIKLESTYSAEKYSVQSARGKIDLSAIDAITTKIQLEKIEETIEEVKQTTKHRLEKMEETIREMTKTTICQVKEMKSIEEMTKALTENQTQMNKIVTKYIKEKWNTSTNTDASKR